MRILGCLVLLACSSSPAVEDGGTDAGGGTDTGVATDTGGCTPDANHLCVDSIKVKVVDEKAAAIAGLEVTLCDGATCDVAKGMTDATGSVSIVVGKQVGKSAALKFRGKTAHASTLILVGASGAVDKGTVMLPSLPPTGEPLPSDGGAFVISSAGVVMNCGYGATFQVDQTEFPTTNDRLFRAVLSPIAAAPPAEGAPVVAVAALSPFASGITPGAGFTLPNGANIAANTAVELLQQDTVPTSPTFTKMVKIADGHVSADGLKIQTDSGQEVTMVSWVGVRVK